MDSLAILINLAQITGSINVLCQFQGEWCVQHPHKRAHGMIHFVTHGEGWLHVGTHHAPQKVQAGDLIVLPHSSQHILSSDQQCSLNPPPDFQPQHQTQGALTLIKHENPTLSHQNKIQLFCADFQYEIYADLFKGLPEVLHFNTRRSQEFQHILALLQHEAHSAQAASHHVLNALLQILLVQILRRYLSGKNELSGILKGLYEKRLRGVITAVLSAPEQDWTVEYMAEQAHLSRAQLMRLFKQHTDMTPHAFVNHIRLLTAAKLLRQSADSVLNIALSVGFQSETHFGKAFKKQYGIAPGAYRKRGTHHHNPEDEDDEI